ncbi:NAC domain [Macleaya cordata]|uniref:NAC domain n=1 Tax=Macleaya cordata TaxID=56857 RepID=A0A200PYW8_MACCD|nr:NAC domain [Macleaya cordata]
MLLPTEKFEWYRHSHIHIFTPRTRSFPFYYLINRRAGDGFWKEDDNGDIQIIQDGATIGYKKGFVFHRGLYPAQPTSWTMMEYRVQEIEHNLNAELNFSPTLSNQSAGRSGNVSGSGSVGAAD